MLYSVDTWFLIDYYPAKWPWHPCRSNLDTPLNWGSWLPGNGYALIDIIQNTLAQYIDAFNTDTIPVDIQCPIVRSDRSENSIN